MYGSGSHIFALWSYVIAHTKPDAMVELNPDTLSHTIGEDITRVVEAIEHFKSPDPRSRSKEFEGRRLIQKGEYIYFVPQYHKYHGFANDKERREYFAQKKREQRQRDKESQTVKSKMSNGVQQSEAESEKETKTKINGEHPEFLEELKRNPFNTGVDIDGELVKAQRWCKKKGRRCTQRFFTKWVERADRLVAQPSKPKSQTQGCVDVIHRTKDEDQPLSDEKRVEISNQLKNLCQQMKMPSPTQ